MTERGCAPIVGGWGGHGSEIESQFKVYALLILNVIQGPDKGRQFELPDTEPQLIGRSSEALPLVDTTISRRHSELTPDNGNWLINDLDSANGTYVNGVRIKGPTRLRSGDQIRTGATILVFGRVSNLGTKPVRVASSDQMETAVESTISSNDESVIMAVPDPSEAAVLHLKIMYELMQVVGSIYDQQVLLERVMDLVFEHFEPDRGFVLVRLESGDETEPAVVRYRNPSDEKRNKEITVSRTIVQHVLDASEGVLSSNAMSDRRFSAGDSVKAFGIRSAICVPIHFRQKVYGVICIDSKLANYTFTEDQLRLMTAIGAHTGMAMENARLYQEGMQQARLAAVGETVASLSHSIRNILQAMRGGAEVVEMGLRKKDLGIVTNGWDILARNLDRIYQLTMNMLAFSKQRKPEFEMVSLPTLLGEIVELIQPQCDRRNVALITEVHEDIPPLPCDQGGIHQAVMNLLSNALDVVDPGSGVVTLRAEYDQGGQEVRISVSDNGDGIDDQTMRRLFHPFYSTKGLRGTGLGLAVTKKIIEEHGGSIRVESKFHEGSTFILRLSTRSRQDPSATVVRPGQPERT